MQTLYKPKKSGRWYLDEVVWMLLQFEVINDNQYEDILRSYEKCEERSQLEARWYTPED